MIYWSKIKFIRNNEVHIFNPNGKTACGFDIKDNPKEWKTVSENSKIICKKIDINKREPMILIIGSLLNFNYFARLHFSKTIITIYVL